MATALAAPAGGGGHPRLARPARTLHQIAPLGVRDQVGLNRRENSGRQFVNPYVKTFDSTNSNQTVSSSAISELYYWVV